MTASTHAIYGTVPSRYLMLPTIGSSPLSAFTVMSDVGICGHPDPCTPAAAGSRPTMHLAALDDPAATAERMRADGGTVMPEPITIPARMFHYRTDPDGNSIGFFTG